MVRDFTIDDYFNYRNISGVDFSQDGSKISYVILDRYKEYKGEVKTQIGLYSLINGEQKVFSQPHWSDFLPRFSPSGKKLAYLSRKEGEEYRLVIKDLERESGEEVVIKGTSPTVTKGGPGQGDAQDLRWEGETSIILLIKDIDPQEEAKKDKKDAYFFEENPKFSSLWRYQLGSGFQRLTEGIQVWEFVVNDGIIAAVTSSSPYEWSWYEAGISIIDLENHQVRKIYSPSKRQVAKPRLSPNNEHLIFLESLWSDRGVVSGDIMKIDIKNGKVENLTDSVEESFSEMQWKSNEEFYTLSNNEGTFNLYLVNGENRKPLWSKYGIVHAPWSSSFSVSGRKAALSYESSKQRNELIVIDLNSGKEEVATDINSRLAEVRSYDSEMVRWKSPDGTEVSGIFRSAGKDTPLMVLIHGGPTSFSWDSFTGVSMIGIESLFLSKGYSVFLPNFRGSIGKGRKFAEKNRGDMGGADLQDILSGIEFLSENRSVDRNNVFISGGSYGGFMSAWAITQTDVFRGAIPFAGISDWISFHGVSDVPLWIKIHYDEDPYKFKKFLEFSPLWHTDNVTSSVLLVHGAEDSIVPVGQFYQFFRALKDKGKDVKFLLFPREAHGLLEKDHLIQYYEEIFKWLDEKKQH